MHRVCEWERVVVDAAPFFSFAENAALLEMIGYLQPRLAIARSVERELNRNAKTKFPSLRAVQLVSPPIDVIDLSANRIQLAGDRARAIRKPTEHPGSHLGEAQTAYLADQLGVSTTLVIGEDKFLKRLTKNLKAARMSTAQLAAEMVVAKAITRGVGEAVYVRAGGDATYFPSTIRDAEAAAARG